MTDTQYWMLDSRCFTIACCLLPIASLAMTIMNIEKL